MRDGIISKGKIVLFISALCILLSVSIGHATVIADITQIKPVTVVVKQNEQLRLPATVNATLKNKSIVKVPVVWDTQRISTAKVGSQKTSGQVKGYTHKVALEVKVLKYIVSIDDLNLTVLQHNNYQMPDTIRCRMSDGTESKRAIYWNDKLFASQPGAYTTTGSVVGYTRQVRMHLIVNRFIVSTKDLMIELKQGEAFQAPETVTAQMSDGSEVQLPVEWSKLNVNPNVPGTYSTTGELKGYSGRVTLLVIVKSDKLTAKEISGSKNAVVSVYPLDHHNNYTGSGSGFLISGDGVVVTCYHVIEGAKNCLVMLENGKRYGVEGVLNFSKEKDIAVLKLKEAESMPFVELGDSDKLEVGDEVVAIGNPQGYVNTVSSGIVSGLSRESDIREGADVQFTAGITNGSSGGALFSMNGKVIGMTYSGYRSGNLNLSIPSTEIKTFLKGWDMKKLGDLHPMSKDERLELELGDHFRTATIGGQGIELGEIYLDVSEKSKYVEAQLNYYGGSYDQFKKSIGNPTDVTVVAKNKAEYATWLEKLYQELRIKYPGMEIYCYVDAKKTFDTKPSTEEFPGAELNRRTGKWEAYVTIVEFGDEEDKGYEIFWLMK